MQMGVSPEIVGDTIVHTLRENGRRFPGRPALRRRTRDGWETLTYRDYVRRVAEVSAGLVEMGVGPSEHVGILSNNRVEWHLADFGSMAIGAAVVPIYQTSSAEQVAYILDHSESRVCFVESEEFLAKVLEVRDQLPKLHRVVVFEDGDRLDDPFVVGFDEVCAVGAQALERDPERFERLADAVKADDVATLVYTSGTTGPPKGAEVTHANIMWVMRAAIPFLHCTRGERFLSFLPLSHVAERMISDFCSVAVTGETWFARSLSTVVEDLGECRPTIFFAVPRVWEKLHEAVVARIADSPPVLDFVVQRYIQLGQQVTARRQTRMPVPVWEDLALRGMDAAIGSRIRQQLGLDKAHILASSAAPVSPDLLRWLHAVGLPVIELYGQTEACGPSTCNPPEDIRIGTVGVAIPGVELKIASDGEVLVRGGNVCRGYFRDPDSTAELIDGDGWMHTGDIGQIDPDGYLTITGRKKDLIITAAGQNISPQEIEEDLRHNGLISEAVVVGEGRRYLTALVTLDEEAVVPWARRHGKVADYEALVSDPDLHAEIDRTIGSVNQRHARVENIRKYRVLPHEFTVASGEFTPTFKVKRHAVTEHYGSLVEEMYAE